MVGWAGKSGIRGIAALAITALVPVSFHGLEALAQTAGVLADDDFAPEARRLTGSVEFSGESGLSAPSGADRLIIELGGVDVDGTLPGMETATAAFEERLTGGPIRVSEIFEAAQELEAAYAEAGLVLARVVLPAQDLRDGGTLQLAVVNGFVEAIDDANVPPELRERMLSLTQPLVGQRTLRLRELERRLLIAGDTYGVALGSALSTGSTPGGTVVVLDPNYRPFTGFVTADNRLSDPLGTMRFEAGFELNSKFEMGEVIYGRVAGSPDILSADARLRTFALGSVVPVGTDGLAFNVEGTLSQTNPDTTGIATESMFQRASFRVNYPWVRSRDLNFSSQLSFDFQKDELDTVGGGAVHRDDLRVLRLTSDLAWAVDEQAFFQAGAILSKGLDAFGARNAAEAASSGIPLSRTGTDADFTKLELSAKYQRRLTETIEFSLAGRAQTSFGDPLASGEQIVVGNSGELSVFDDGSLSGDSGYVIRAQVSLPQTAQVQGRQVHWVPYVFAAHSQTRLEEPVAPEQSATKASAVGIGVEVIGPQANEFSSASVTIEYGKGFRNDDEPDGSRLSLSSSYRF